MANLRELKHSQSSAEWYTPPVIVAAARQVMGSIQLDPASSHEANQIVQAEQIFTISDHGLRRRWIADTLLLNAPGHWRRGVSGQDLWQSYLEDAIKLGYVGQAVMVVFNIGTGTQRFQRLLGQVPICLCAPRIRFIPSSGRYEDTTKNSPTNDSAIVYFGDNRRCFAQVFSQFGKVIPAWEVG